MGLGSPSLAAVRAPRLHPAACAHGASPRPEASSSRVSAPAAEDVPEAAPAQLRTHLQGRSQTAGSWGCSSNVEPLAGNRVAGIPD